VKNLLASILVLALAAFAVFGADLKLPEKVTGDPGSFIRIPAETKGATVKWYVVDPGLNLFPVDLLKDTKTAVVTTTKEGTYRVLGYTSDASGPSDPAVCVVVVGAPVPPTPPTPPAPPTPTDPLAKAVQAAYDADPDPTKAKHFADYAALWRQASTQTVFDANIKDTESLLTVMIKARQVLMPDTALASIRKIVGAKLNETLATPMTLDDATRAKVSATFKGIADSLSQVRTTAAGNGNSRHKSHEEK